MQLQVLADAFTDLTSWEKRAAVFKGRQTPAVPLPVTVGNPCSPKGCVPLLPLLYPL